MDNDKLASLIDNLDYGPAPESEAKTREWIKAHGSKFSHSINGVWRLPEKGEYFKTINPAKSDEVLAEIALGTQEDVDAAVHAAKAAFPAWSALSGHKRACYRQFVNQSRGWWLRKSVGRPCRPESRW